jgi:hypothetical protein
MTLIKNYNERNAWFATRFSLAPLVAYSNHKFENIYKTSFPPCKKVFFNDRQLNSAFSLEKIMLD